MSGRTSGKRRTFLKSSTIQKQLVQVPKFTRHLILKKLKLGMKKRLTMVTELKINAELGLEARPP